MITDEEIYKIYFLLPDDLKEKFLIYLKSLKND